MHREKQRDLWPSVERCFTHSTYPLRQYLYPSFYATLIKIYTGSQRVFERRTVYSPLLT